MAQASVIEYGHKELVSLMLRDQNITDGIWMLQVKFAFGAGNFGSSEADVNPTGFVGVAAIGLSKQEVPGPLTVDAATVNPTKEGGPR